MSSALPKLRHRFTTLGLAEARPPLDDSFWNTLDRYLAQERANRQSAPKLSVVREPKAKLPKPAGSPLARGEAAEEPKTESIPQAEAVARPDAVPQPAEPPVRKEIPEPRNPGLLIRAWSWLQKNHKFSSVKQLRVAETVALGEKRFVALVQVGEQKFLIGGGTSGVSLLTQLGTAQEPAAVLQAAADAERSK